MKKNLVRKHLVWLLFAAWVYTLTFIFNNYWSKYASYESVTASFQKALTEEEQVFDNWVQDTPTLKKLATGIESLNLLRRIQKLPFDVFVFSSDDSTTAPLFWSSNAVLPDAYHVDFYPSGSFVKYGNGQYELLKRKLTVGGREIIVVGLIQMHREFFIENGTLKSEYPGFEGLGDKMQLVVTPTPYPLIGENGKPIVYFQPLVQQPIFVYHWVTVVIELFAAVFLFIFIHQLATDLVKKRLFPGVLFFVLALMLLRYCILQFGMPINLNQFPLFRDGELLYPESTTELRDFMVNAFFGIWGGTFLLNNTGIILKFLGSFKQGVKWVIISVLCLCVIGGHFLLVYLIRNLYLNSAVAFDVNNFFGLNYTTILSFVIIFLLCINHYIVLRFMVLALMRLSRSKIWKLMIMLSISGLVIVSLIPDLSLILPLLFSLIWLLLFFLAGFLRLIKPARTSSGMVVAWLFIYATSISLLLGMLSEERLHNRIFELSRNLILRKDQISEGAVRVATAEMRRINWLSILADCRSERICEGKKDSIIDLHFGGYLDRFDTNIYLFDRNQNGVHNNHDVSFESLNTLYNNQARPAGEEGLVIFGESFEQFGYIFKKEITGSESNGIAGHLFVVVRSITPGDQVLTPELFRETQDFAVDLPQGYSYAWYSHGTLVEQYRNYPFQTTLPAPMSRNQSRWEQETTDAYELWSKAGPNTVLAMVAKRSVFLSFVSMLAYLFGAFLILYSILALSLLLINGRLLSGKVFERLNLNLQSKIRITVIAILMISFVIVAVVTISFFIRQFRVGNAEKLAKAVQTISTDLGRSLPANFDEFSLRERRSLLQSALNRITQGQKIDVNCYDSSGRVIATTQSILFEKDVIGPMADPVVWWNLTQGEVHRYISSEKIGNLQYTSVYQPLLSRQSELDMYIQIPFFASQNELNQEISNFLVILINIIALVFLVSGTLAYWISGNITRSFNVIAEKMNRIRLSEHNERIEWAPKDEIGNLVFQYNKMVDQLEDSAKKMAKTQREMAWREMARQVAHEIKNPLTPMKLSLQFLQKAIKEQKADVLQISERVAGNLVGQIDHLSKIATEFSQFANLGMYKPELFNVQYVMREVIQMYELQENLAVSWHSLSQPLMIYADKTQINRLFTNLLQNAVEAGKGDKLTQIVVEERLVPGAVVLSFTDDGAGIPEEIRQNIFMPNFTTKSSGTGLGLSICKAIVENAGGDIWFETESNAGTTFFVELPLVRSAS